MKFIDRNKNKPFKYINRGDFDNFSSKMKSPKFIKGVFILFIAFFIFISQYSIPTIVLDKGEDIKNYTLNNATSPWSWPFTDDICKTDTTGICNENFAYKAHFEAFTKDKESFWRSISRSTIQNIRNGVQKHLIEFDHNNFGAPVFKGRGIVFSSNAKSLRMVFVSIKFIRGYGCKLPIEIWFFLN
jgi:hypothetical protein